MTYSHDRRTDYANQGQQDDYFDQELAKSGHSGSPPTSSGEPLPDQYVHQGQQDDYFNQDLNRSNPTPIRDEESNP